MLGPVGRAQEYDPSRLHKERAKITVPALGNTAKDVSIVGRDLSRHETKPKSRPRRKADPSPMVATMPLAMIGPMPGTVIRRWQASSSRATGSISVDALVKVMQVRGEILDHVHHSRRQHIGAIGEKVRERLAQEAQILAHGNAALEQEGPDLVYDGGALADQTRTTRCSACRSS